MRITARMSRIVSSTVIHQPIEHVWEYVTTPGNWPRWHPSSLAVTGAANHSLDLGEQVTEEFLVAGRLGRAVWTVIEREAPYRWVIRGEIAGNRGGAGVRYLLHQRTDGSTHFERELTYLLDNPLQRLLDRFFIRKSVERESAEAVDRLRRRLEGLAMTPVLTAEG